MNFGEKDVKRLSTIVLIIILLGLIFLLLRPVLMSVIGGLILAYALMPLFRFVNKYITNKNVASFLVMVLIVIVLIIPLWFIIPVVSQQVFDFFTFSQTFHIEQFVRGVFPSASDQFVVQISLTFNTLITKGSAGILNYLVDLLLNLPTIGMHAFIIVFIAFFSMRDSQKLLEFAKGLSPISESKEKILVKHFKDMTDSVIYGQVIVGLIQGLLAGIGLFVFGVDNAIVLTLVAMLASIIPFLGPFIIWVPVAIYLFASGEVGTAMLYGAYNLFIVSVADNLLRSYIVSKKTNIPAAVVLIGMIGGLFVFGILGLIIGPLLLAYLLTLLESLKDKSIYSLFSE